MFEADIEQMSGRTVEQYVGYMEPDFIFADQIMVIALCLYLDVSITLFQKGLETINACTFAPVHSHLTKHLNIYLDLYGSHYDCILSSPVAHEQVCDDVGVLTDILGRFLCKIFLFPTKPNCSCYCHALC